MLQEEFDTLVPAQGNFNRRAFVRTAVGTGFAAAVLLLLRLRHLPRVDRTRRQTREAELVEQLGAQKWRNKSAQGSRPARR